MTNPAIFFSIFWVCTLRVFVFCKKSLRNVSESVVGEGTAFWLTTSKDCVRFSALNCVKPWCNTVSEKVVRESRPLSERAGLPKIKTEN